MILIMNHDMQVYTVAEVCEEEIGSDSLPSDRSPSREASTASAGDIGGDCGQYCRYQILMMTDIAIG